MKNCFGKYTRSDFKRTNYRQRIHQFNYIKSILLTAQFKRDNCAHKVVDNTCTKLKNTLRRRLYRIFKRGKGGFSNYEVRQAEPQPRISPQSCLSANNKKKIAEIAVRFPVTSVRQRKTV